MGGENPYIKAPVTQKPQSNFKVSFHPEGQVVEIQSDSIPTSATGLPGSILDIALAVGIDIDHACGGVCACSTCHVIVEEGLSTCSEATEDEDDQLEVAPGLTSRSRLACQCVPNGTQNIKVLIPNWNRNLVRE